MNISVLVVDDEAGFRDLLKYELGDKGMAVETAENGATALRIAQKKHFDIIVTDITMPEMDGLKFMESIKKVLPDIEVIVVTGFGTVETAVYAMQHGASNFLLKPYDMKFLLNCIETACQQKAQCRTCGRKDNVTR
jgi:DNA-binding NtrC family response regulator